MSGQRRSQMIILLKNIDWILLQFQIMYFPVLLSTVATVTSLMIGLQTPCFTNSGEYLNDTKYLKTFVQTVRREHASPTAVTKWVSSFSCEIFQTQVNCNTTKDCKPNETCIKHDELLYRHAMVCQGNYQQLKKNSTDKEQYKN